MPALKNQRWERFAQLIVYGADVTQKDAYIRAGYKTDGNSAETNACRLLRIAQPVLDRIKELQNEQKQQLAKKDRYTREAIAQRLVTASNLAEQEKNPSAMATSEMGLAKLYNLLVEQRRDLSDNKFANAQSLHDVGIGLLESVGYLSPSAADVELALKCHALMIEKLEAIAARAGAAGPEH